MNNCWMVRAGDGNQLVDVFDKGCVLIGWGNLGDLTIYPTKDALRMRYEQIWSDEHPGKVSNSVSMLWKFCHDLAVNDTIITYDQARREYSYGKITSAYRFDPKLNKAYPHAHNVTWAGRISRDALQPASRNSLGSTLTLFWVNEEVQDDLAKAFASPKPSSSTLAAIPVVDEQAQLSEIKQSTIAQSFELTKDRIVSLSEWELPKLVAAVLRSLGFKTRVSSPGSDLGVDVLASPDGLGLTEPRIKVEVKHKKNTQIGSQDVRKFLGGFRAGDRGMYMSSGGFTKEARYEAERAQFPVALVDLNALTELVVDNYEKFDAEGRALINLVRIYWPN